MSAGLTRREFVKGTIVGAEALAGLGGASFFSAQAAEPVKRGGIWRYARNRTVPSMDGHRVSEYFTCITALYDCLLDVKIDPNTNEAKLVPGLATEWRWDKDHQAGHLHAPQRGRVPRREQIRRHVAKWNLDRVRSDPKSS